MKAVIRLLVAGALVAVLPFTAAGAQVDQEGTVAVGAPFEWTGEVATGTALGNFTGGTVPGTELECAKTLDSYCEFVLVAFDMSLTQEEIDAGMTRKTANGEISIGNPTLAVYDFDLHIYDSDAEGTKGAEVASVGALDETPGEEAAPISGIRGTIDQPIKYYLVEVVYFSVVQGTYDGVAKITSKPRLS